MYALQCRLSYLTNFRKDNSDEFGKKRRWDSETFRFDEKHNISFPRLMAIANEIKKTRLGHKVLDLGCGLTTLSKILGEDYEYFGCDISHSVVQLHNTPNIVERDLDNEPLPFKEKKFNYVVCSGIIEYLEDVRKFLRDILQSYGHERVLFLITVSNATDVVHRHAMLRGHFPDYPPLWINFYSPKDFRYLLIEHQFNVLRYYPTSYILTRPKVLSSIIRKRFPLLFGGQFLYVCSSRVHQSNGNF